MYFYNDKNSQPATGFLFQVLCKIRWIPLWLFLGMSTADTLSNLQTGQAINWVFMGVCIIAGSLLFHLGSILCYQEYCNERSRQQKMRGKYPQTRRHSNT
jgi:hypothetical protein